MSGNEKHSYRFREFYLDIAERQLLQNNERIALTPKAFDVLAFLVLHSGHLVEKEELMQAIWPDSFVEEANVARIVHTLRRTLGHDSNGNKLIETVPKKGYRFVADVIREDLSEPPFTGYENGRFDKIALEPDNLENNGHFIPAETSPTNGISLPLIDERLFDIDNKDAVFDLPKVSIRRKLSGNSLIWLWLWLPLAVVVLVGIGFVVFRQGVDSTVSKKNLSFDQPQMKKLTRSGDVYGPFISPDGQYLAYISLVGNEQGLSVRQISTDSTLNLAPARPGVKYWALAVAPDNSFLYYIVKEENINYGNVYRIPLLGGQPHKLVDLASGGLAISPDGKNVAFVRIDREKRKSFIVTVNNDGTDEKIVDSLELESAYYSLDWSPDGSSFVCSIKRSEAGRDDWYITEMPVDGGEQRIIGKPSNSKIVAVKWLPDKSGFLANIVDEQSHQPQIYYVSNPAGEMRRITYDLNYYYGISVTKDGKSIVAMNQISVRQIWTLSGDDVRQAKKLTNATEKHYDTLVWDKDGNLIFDEDENSGYDIHNIWRMNQDGSEVRQLTFGPENNKRPTVSPDGNTIVFVSGRSGKQELWRMSIDGNNLTQLTEIPYRIADPEFLPDGQKILFQVAINGIYNLWQLSVDGGEPSMVIDADIYEWAVSPDGKRLAYSTFDKQSGTVKTYIRSFETGKIDLILNIDPETWMRWSNDGNSIYFNTTKDEVKNIWRQSLNGSKPKRVTDFESERIFRFAWSPDGKNLACIRYSTANDAVMFQFE
ncbi:MAG: winged helix-turn-helix domain-containing protein [Pyrinomonadaceae bacterium]